MNEKIDVLELAREAGFLSGSHGVTTKRPSGNCTEEIKKFAALVLERAAVECEKVPDWKETRGYELAESIRAMKPDQGEGKTRHKYN